MQRFDNSYLKTGVYVPLYVYPAKGGWNQWQTIFKTKDAHPSVPFVVVVNPSNGVGEKKDENYVKGIEKLKSLNVKVVGYIYTAYGSRDITEIKSEIIRYKDWYNLDGIMFDEMSNKNGFETYYNILNNFAKSIGMKLTKGNPGTSVPPSFTNVLDNFVIYENSGYPNLSKIKELHFGYEKNNLCFVCYGISNLDKQYVIQASKIVGLMFITNQSLPNPYESIPSYFENLVSILDC